MKVLKIIIGLVVVALVVWAVVTQVGNKGNTSLDLGSDNQEQASEEGVVKIGWIGPLSGDGASIGEGSRAAAEMAVEEINNNGGVDGRELQVLFEDGKCNAKASVNAANKLINVEEVPVIIGGVCSTETSAFGPTAMDEEVVVFSPTSSAPSLSGLGEYFFRSYPSDTLQGSFTAEYAYNEMGVREVAILYHQSAWGNGLNKEFTERFEELGGEVVVAEAKPQKARDYRTALTKIKDADADLIYTPLYTEGAISAFRQASDLGISKPIFGGDVFADTKIQKEAPTELEVYFPVVTTNETQEFRNRLLEKIEGDQFPLGAPQTYDNVKIIAQIMNEVGTDPGDIQNAMEDVEYEGVSGNISFDENGDREKASYDVKKFQDGSAVSVEN